LAATAPLTSNWPRPSPLVDISNWVDDVYLKRRGTNASIGSRFAESEPYARRVVFSLPPWPRSSPVKRPSIPNVPSFAPASQLHQELKIFHQLRIIHPADRPRFTKPGSLCFSMVHDLIQPPSALQGSAATIPLLDFDLPFILFTLTALTLVSLNTSTSSLLPIRLKTLNMTGTRLTSLRNAYRS
jgi:hypothetical protein